MKDKLNSCLYNVHIMHDRRSPKQYRFNHTVFMFYLDLDEVDQLPKRSWLFGYNQARVYDYRETDHINQIRETLSKEGVNEQVKHIRLLTNVRTFGYIFNPVSFYFCFDEKELPVCVIVEIGNTFRELKYFVLGPEKKREAKFKDKQVKYYYISPFFDLDNVLDFDIAVPDEQLKIGIDVQKENKTIFFSSMLGPRMEFNTQNLLRCTLLYPWVTLKVIVLIHWHAAVLHFAKQIAHHAKEDNEDMQRDLHRRWKKR